MIGLVVSSLLCAFAVGASPGNADSAELCGRCHRAIYDAWNTSKHAQAMESRLFQDALEVAEQDFGSGGRKTCLGCHAPVATLNNDLSLIRKASWEGVTCDYCHSIREVSLAGGNPKATVAFGPVKSGPWEDSVSSGHRTVYSEVHTSSLVCAPCHEYSNAQGFPVLTTYSEWRSTKYAKAGQGCQFCHMSRVEGDVVDPSVARARQTKINLHQMPGSHSVPQLNRALLTRLSAVRDGGQVRVTVEITNRNAGHYMPTGSPLRELSLEVLVDAGQGRTLRGERVYARRIADRDNKPVTLEPVAFINGAKVVSDSRLAAGETRKEQFAFNVPGERRTRVKANFWYHYSPLAKKESEKEIMFLSLTQYVP
jgi:Cytochrome c554 and c-prime